MLENNFLSLITLIWSKIIYYKSYPDGKCTDPNDGKLKSVLHDECTETAVESRSTFAGHDLVSTIDHALKLKVCILVLYSLFSSKFIAPIQPFEEKATWHFSVSIFVK